MKKIKKESIYNLLVDVKTVCGEHIALDIYINKDRIKQLSSCSELCILTEYFDKISFVTRGNYLKFYFESNSLDIETKEFYLCKIDSDLHYQFEAALNILNDKFCKKYNLSLKVDNLTMDPVEDKDDIYYFLDHIID